MEDLLQPFKIGQDIALFLVNIERTCEKAGFSLESWPQELLTLLPCEAADVIARLNRKDAVSYDKVKEALLRKCRLSAKAFRQRLSHARKARTSDEGTHGGRGKMANRHEECLGRGKGSVLALVSDGLQELTEVKDTLFSHYSSVGSAECKGQREGSLKGSDKAPVKEETLQSQLTSLESIAAVVQSQDITDDDRESSSVLPFGALTPQNAKLKAWPEIPKRRARAKRIPRKRMSMRFRRRGFRLFSSFSLPCRGRSATTCRAHRYRDKGSKVCSKRRAKRRKRPQDSNAAKVATRLRKKFRRRREIARKARLSLLNGFYSMRLNHQEKRRREAHGSRKGSVGKGTPRCSFRGTLDQVRNHVVGEFCEAAGGDKCKSVSRNVVGLDEGVIKFHACRTPRLTRVAFWARPPRVRLKSC
ncbi:hypothetical protein HPB52_002522 [Rhipicephalus sanguineus]|uniref:Uncharacterized protein n=1 Tax=Rhipicephalus sanguineus TaxID=34632 RepID=A0A9D4QJU1_RHISA|nr:hypothetical protein HPB52_002522 [Rhipicephalus sanguineus]